MPPLIGSGRKIIISPCFLFIFPFFNCIFHNEVLCYICLRLKSINQSILFGLVRLFSLSVVSHTKMNCMNEHQRGLIHLPVSTKRLTMGEGSLCHSFTAVMLCWVPEFGATLLKSLGNAWKKHAATQHNLWCVVFDEKVNFREQILTVFF